MAGLKWLATAPQSRGQGLGSHLLAAAERQAAEDGALVGLLRTSIPHFFRRTGWALCGQPCFSQANTRTVLARLLDEGLRRHRRRHHHRLHIRPWRRWEEKALVRIYRQNLPGRYGPLDRTLAYWQWLLRRQAYDQIYVALDGPDLWDLEEVSTAVVGYVVLKGQRVVELMTAPGRPKVAAELLAHACGDAIEHDHHSIIAARPARQPLPPGLRSQRGPARCGAGRAASRPRAADRRAVRNRRRSGAKSTWPGCFSPSCCWSGSAASFASGRGRPACRAPWNWASRSKDRSTRSS